MAMKGPKEHWNDLYSNKPVDRLGWYEESPQPSIDLFKKCGLKPEDVILNVGAGASTFIDYLLAEKYGRIIAADISEIAIKKLKERIGREKSPKIRWIIDDLTNPKHLHQLRDIALWHDRAVLHFFTQPGQQLSYFNLLRQILRPDGYVIIAAFSLSGAKKCSGLDVVNYNAEMISDKLGRNFKLLHTFDYTYTMPSGETRDYIYSLFQKI